MPGGRLGGREGGGRGGGEGGEVVEVFGDQVFLGAGGGGEGGEVGVGGLELGGVVGDDGEDEGDEGAGPGVGDGVADGPVAGEVGVGLGGVADDEVGGVEEYLEAGVEFAVVDFGEGEASAEG